jgi:SOS-response transcriptional repressor LexA
MTTEVAFHDGRIVGVFRLRQSGKSVWRACRSHRINPTMQDADHLRTKLRAVLERRELDPVPLAVELGKGRDYLTDFLNARKHSLGANFLIALARRLEIQLSDLTGAQEGGSSRPVGARELTRDIAIMGEVAAGVWREAIFREFDGTQETFPVSVLGYERCQLYGLKVVGNSMNLIYRPGEYVVVAPSAEAGVNYGDHVIVQRERAGLVEVTVKELVDEDGRAALRPRSSDPEFQSPLYFDGDDADTCAPKIIGVVVAHFGRRDRPLNKPFERPMTWAE